MHKHKNIRRGAFIIFLAVSIVLLYFIIDTVRSVILTRGEWTAVNIATTAVGALLIIALYAVAALILNSVRKDDSPFMQKNVNRLKLMSVLLIALELHMYFSQWLANRYYPITLDGGIRIEQHSSRGGCILVAGLIVYCIALVFEHGISLQQQVDETL